jgi:AcrR family transcriptional regulator
MAKTRRGFPLDLNEIASAALIIVDEDGLEALTMRTLASKLACSPMALYNHLGDRNELLQLVASQVLMEVSIPRSALSDQEWFNAVGASIRQAMARHQNAMPLIATSFLTSPQDLVLIDLATGRLLNMGLPISVVIARLNSFFGGLIGYLSVEFAPRPPRARTLADLNELVKPHPHLHVNRNSVRGKLIGIRDGTTPMPKSGFDHLINALITATLNPNP